MRLQDLALASARVAIASEKASDELSALLDKWFAKHLVKGITLPGVAGACTIAGELFGVYSPADALPRATKPRRHRPVLRERGPPREIEAGSSSSSPEMVAHIPRRLGGRSSGRHGISRAKAGLTARPDRKPTPD